MSSSVHMLSCRLRRPPVLIEAAVSVRGEISLTLGFGSALFDGVICGASQNFNSR